MGTPRFKRRKEARPAEITTAALKAFSENGYAATRVEDVARRAGVSKGLLYRYFRTKEDLFKAVILSFIVPRLQHLGKLLDESDMSSEEYLRGPFLEFIKTLPDSPARIIVRLMVAEGPRHPDLTAFYWENVVANGIGMLRRLVRKGVESGEFRETAMEEFPQLLLSPVLMSLLWKILFDEYDELDTDRLLDAHLDAVVHYLKTSPDAGANNE